MTSRSGRVVTSDGGDASNTSAAAGVVERQRRALRRMQAINAVMRRPMAAAWRVHTQSDAESSRKTASQRHRDYTGRRASKAGVQLFTLSQQLLRDLNITSENTYRMGPPDRLFNSETVELLLSQLLVQILTGHRYSANSSARTAKDIVTSAMKRLKALSLARYKYVVMVSIGNTNARQPPSLLVGSRCLWNGATDGLSTATYVDPDETFYAVAVAYAVYFE